MENVNEPAQDVRKEEDNGDDNEEDVNPDLEEEVAKNEGKAEEEEAFPGKENNGSIEAVLIGRDKWQKELKMKLKMRIQTARRYFHRKRKAVGDCFKLNCTLWSISFQTLAFDSHIQNVKNGDWSIKNLDRITKTNSCGTSDFAQNGIRCLSEANFCRSPYCHY